MRDSWRHGAALVGAMGAVSLGLWACGSSSETPDASVADSGAKAHGSSSGSGTSSGSASSSGGSLASSSGGSDDATTDDATTDDASETDATLDDGSATDGGTGEGGTTPDAGPSCASTITGPKTTSGLTGWVGDWTAGEYPSGAVTAENYLTIAGVQGQQGLTRQYKVHVPPGYTSGAAVPALFCLHGLGQTAVMFCTDDGVAWPAKSDQEGFVLIMPNGYQNSWNGGTCCGGAASMALDDVALVRAIFAEVGKHVNIDLGRVYATGLSNGAYLSYRLACQASDLFTAVAPSAGAVGTAAIGGGTMATSDLTTCAPTNPISVLDIHGTSDPLIPYSTQAPSLASITSSDSCSSTTTAAVVPPSGGDTTCVTRSGCPTCPQIEVTGCSIDGGGHCWFGSTDCGTGGGAIGKAVVGNDSNFMKNTDQIWSFFSRLSR
jgi:polyhydroxybutyrate depolymerase